MRAFSGYERSEYRGCIHTCFSAIPPVENEARGSIPRHEIDSVFDFMCPRRTTVILSSHAYGELTIPIKLVTQPVSQIPFVLKDAIVLLPDPANE